jgi:hypothetical protein
MIVTRSRYNEMLSLKDGIIADKNEEIKELKSALHRLEDAIFLNNFGVKIYGSPAAEAAQQAPSAETQTPPDVPWSEEEAEEAADMARIGTFRRTSPSRVGPEMERVRAKQALRSLHQVTHGTPESKQAFAAAVGTN